MRNFQYVIKDEGVATVPLVILTGIIPQSR